MKKFSHRQAFIAFIGALLSAYLIYHYVDVRSGFLREPSFCSISAAFDCDRVAKSSYSQFLGVPVAGWGMMFYLGYLLLILLGEGKSPSPEEEKKNRLRLAGLRFALATSTIPVTIALALISKLYIQTMCLMCVLLYFVNIALFFLALNDPERKDEAGNIAPEATLASGLGELFSLLFPFSSSAVRRWPLMGFVVSEVAFVLLLPTVFYEGFLKPQGSEMANRAAAQYGFEKWKSSPFVELPPFEGEGSAQPDLIRGPESAKVTVVEFSDLECPACHNYAPYIWDALHKYGDKVRFVFKNFPIDMSCNRVIQVEKHKYACTAASMAVCIQAEKNEKVWKFIEGAFSLENFNLDELQKVFSTLGVNQKAYEECMAAGRGLQKVKSDIEYAVKINLNSTPGIYVNGRILQVPPRHFAGVLGLIIEDVEKGSPRL